MLYGSGIFQASLDPSRLVTLSWRPWISSFQMAQVLAWSMNVILIGHGGSSGTHRGQFGSLSLSIKTKDQGCFVFVGISAGNMVSGNAGHMIIPTNTNIQEKSSMKFDIQLQGNICWHRFLEDALLWGCIMGMSSCSRNGLCRNKFVKGKFSNFWYLFFCGKHIGGVLDQVWHESRREDCKNITSDDK